MSQPLEGETSSFAIPSSLLQLVLRVTPVGSVIESLSDTQRPGVGWGKARTGSWCDGEGSVFSPPHCDQLIASGLPSCEWAWRLSLATASEVLLEF